MIIRKIGDSPVGNVSGEKLTRFRARNRTTDLLLNLKQRNRPVTEFLHLKIQSMKAQDKSGCLHQIQYTVIGPQKVNNSFNRTV